MCGIIGIIGRAPVTPLLVDALKRLEYRGYDSAGIATLDHGAISRRRAPGKPVTWGTSDFFLEHFGLPSLDDLPGQEELKAAGLLDPRSQPPIFRPEEPDLPLEAGDDEADEPLAVDETGR